ncbi:MAG: DUF924 family protein [Maricaulaceae bacterium]
MILSSEQVHQILDFWFHESGKTKWFKQSDGFDADVRHRFEVLSISLAAQPKLVPESSDMGLAMVLCLDQFPRNMYRGTPAAFAWDDKALSCSDYMVEKKWDLKLGQERRAFVYMSYMHAENLAMQKKSVELIDRGLDNENTLFHARAHLKVIEEFGRFPHRNEILGREMTVEEQAYLADGGYRP